MGCMLSVADGRLDQLFALGKLSLSHENCCRACHCLVHPTGPQGRGRGKWAACVCLGFAAKQFPDLRMSTPAAIKTSHLGRWGFEVTVARR